MLLSVVVPCLDEAPILDRVHAELVAVLRELPRADYEVIYVDDGSTDETMRVLRDLAQSDPHVHYLSLSRHFGKEAAMLAGLGRAGGDAVVVMDADLQHPPALIKQMVAEYENGFDQVIARRDRFGEPLGRRMSTRVYYWIAKRLADVPVRDGVGDFRLLSRRAVDALLSLGEYNRFSKGLFSWIGFEAVEIPYENVAAPGRKSRWTFSRLVNYAIDSVISFNDRPLRVSMYLGLITTAVALLYSAVVILRAIVSGVDLPGYVTLVTSVLVIGGVQLVFLGVLGEYLGKVFYEVKRRPHYLVKETDKSAEVRR
jgi:polyisoprenyl-phosphate glycosyltransferase